MKVIDFLFFGGYGIVGKFMIWFLITFILLCFPDYIPQIPVAIAGLTLTAFAWFYTFFKAKKLAKEGKLPVENNSDFK